MAKRLIRCLHEEDLNDIESGKWPTDVCRVYYGFNTYTDTPSHINELVEIIKNECPNYDVNDMHVHYVTNKESIRHAHFTMVQITESIQKVRDNIRDYCIL